MIAPVLDRIEAVLARVVRPRDDHGALARVLGPDELGGGPWELSEQITLRIGPLFRRPDWAARAGNAGQVAGLRVFVDRTTHRTLSIQVTRLADDEDARQALSSLLPGLRRESARHRRLIDQREVDPPEVAGVDASCAHEQFVAGAGYRLTLAVTQASTLIVLRAKGRAWSWPELVPIVHAELEHLARLAAAPAATQSAAANRTDLETT